MKKLLLLIIGLGFIVYVLPFILRGDLDRANPFFEKKYVYAVAEGYGIPNSLQKGRYLYVLNGVDESGKEKEYEVGVGTPNDFIRKTYLRITVQGRYVFSFEKVLEKEIPEKAKKKLNI
ncbi:YxeA family protein [Bacillus cereus group sp. TH152-1LC]|uniref:YxeA family protein n=1 Tax=Bacillus cereus group sp. TH152-1LC TaxID=3018060 RepID=UPI0022E65389|nr:YxeA family protein [Bacillus cereus group sp. TH152-1LC]MDA1675379.1 YxeA family protein [Bacillus cereus group sp. TH152-1LC]